MSFQRLGPLERSRASLFLCYRFQGFRFRLFHLFGTCSFDFRVLVYSTGFLGGSALQEFLVVPTTESEATIL